jgi:hypothetical protein
MRLVAVNYEDFMARGMESRKGVGNLCRSLGVIEYLRENKALIEKRFVQWVAYKPLILVVDMEIERTSKELMRPDLFRI